VNLDRFAFQSLCFSVALLFSRFAFQSLCFSVALLFSRFFRVFYPLFKKVDKCRFAPLLHEVMKSGFGSTFLKGGFYKSGVDRPKFSLKIDVLVCCLRGTFFLIW
jgi:hypothetical protein